MTRDEIRLELEVPGTPEAVWEAISTGPGISAWFVPAEVAAGSITTHHGPGMDFTGQITAREPGRRFAWREGDVATEFVVEARAGGACVVRVVTSGGDADWYERVERGWRDCLDALRLYLGSGGPAGSIFVTGESELAVPETWARLTSALERDGERAAFDGFAGTVRRAEEGTLILHLDTPTPGVLSLFAYTPGAGTAIRLHAQLYGEHALAVAARVEPRWREWMEARFPPAWSVAEIAA